MLKERIAIALIDSCQVPRLQQMAVTVVTPTVTVREAGHGGTATMMKMTTKMMKMVRACSL